MATSPIVFSSIESLKNSAITTLSSMDFYVQGVMIIFCLTLAITLGALTRRYAKRRIIPIQSEAWHIAIMLPAKLTAPLISIILLGVLKPLVSEWFGEAHYMVAATKLAIAWGAAVVVSAVVHQRWLARILGYAIIVLTLLAISGLLQTTAAYLDSMALEIGTLRISVLGILKGLILMALLFWLASTTACQLERYVSKAPNLNYGTRELIIKLMRIVLYFLAFVIALNAVGIDLTALAVFGGALGVGIGFGLQKITANFISGIILLFDKSVKPGDYVQLGNDTGFVRQIAVRYTLIETLDGREVLIPNEELVASRVTNWTYTTNKARVDIELTISYKSDPHMARALMLEAVKESAHSIQDPAPDCFMQQLGENGIQFMLMFWIEDISQGRRAARSDVLFRILEKLRSNQIELPFPQREVRMVQA